MSKKQKGRKPRGWLVAPAQIDHWLADAAMQLAIRETGQLPQVVISNPYDRAHVSQTLLFTKE